MVEINCPKCGWDEWEFDDGYFTCNQCGHKWYSGLDYDDVYSEDAGCDACGNPDYPKCKWSCPLIDE